MLQISVLGPLDLRQSNGISLAFESLKARALLVYLAVEWNHVHSRETIASMFWSDRSDSVSLANLRHTLASLRTSLGKRSQRQDGMEIPFFNISPYTIQFNHDSSVWVDLNEFEQHLQAADLEKEVGSQTRIAELSAAVNIYRGPFLEGFSLKGCQEFDDWNMLRRENISLKLQKVLDNLADAQVAVGRWEAALASLRHLLQLDPWNEVIQRKVMTLLADHDQRNAALNQYERCRKLLLDDLGVNPEDETVRLYEEIKSGQFVISGMGEKSGNRFKGSGANVYSEKLPRNQFVGRKIALDRLYQALLMTTSEQGQLIFITGEAGSGKTSLAWEFAHKAMAQHSDLLVAAGRCNAITGLEDPFLPFREIIQMLVGGKGVLPGRNLTPEHRGRLTDAFPETMKSLLEGGPDLIDSFIQRESLFQRIETFSPMGHDWQRNLKQFLTTSIAGSAHGSLGTLARKPNEAVTCMLTELSQHRPLLLFIDDLQWADIGSISLLHHLAKRLAGSRILIIGAYRPQDIAPGRQESGFRRERHPLERVQLELRREFGDIMISLDEPEGIDFIDALVDREPNFLGTGFRRMLSHLTDGNPLFTVELLHTMQERGNLVRDNSGRWVEGEPFNWEKLPGRVEAVIAERIGRLKPAEQKLLRVASVEGEVFTAEVVARVLGFEVHRVVNWLSGSLSQEQQIVSSLHAEQTGSTPSSPLTRLSRYRFSHFLFQKYLYNRIDSIERSALHKATGNALEALFGPNVADIALNLGWHFEQGNQILRAVQCLLTAGKQAANLFAYSEAKALYDRCLRLIQKLPESPERDRFEIHVQLAREVPLLVTNGWGNPEAAHAANRVIELLENHHGSSLDSSVLLALYFLSDYFSARNNMHEALARVNLLLSLVNPNTERIYQVLSYAMAGQVYLLAGQPVTSAEYLDKAISNYRKEDQAILIELVGHNVLYASLTWNAWAQWIQGYPDRSNSLSLEVIELARKHVNPFFTAIRISIIGALLSAICNEPEKARAYAQECLGLIDPGTVHIGKIISETVLGWAMVKQGEIESGIAIIQNSVNEWRTAGVLTLQPMSVMLLADALSLAGQTEAGLKVVASTLEMIEQTGRWMFESHVVWLQGEILFREQRKSSSNMKTDLSPADCFERAIMIARRQQARSLELRATTSLARLFKDDGRAGEGVRRLEAIIRQFTEGFETNDLCAARELLAELSVSCQ